MKDYKACKMEEQKELLAQFRANKGGSPERIFDTIADNSVVLFRLRLEANNLDSAMLSKFKKHEIPFTLHLVQSNRVPNGALSS